LEETFPEQLHIEAEFVEEENCYLSMDLIKKCIDPDAKFLTNEYFGF
jgi:hypothetical protein